MPVEPIIQFMKCFTNVLELAFITSDQINHIRHIIINIGRPSWYYLIIKPMNGYANYSLEEKTFLETAISSICNKTYKIKNHHLAYINHLLIF